MTPPDWRDTEPEPGPVPPRRAVRGRTDFEDSLLSARREIQAQERRKSQAMREALRGRPLASDPEGKIFRAARDKAIQARRAENLKLGSPEESDYGFSPSLVDVWADVSAAHRPQVRPSIPRSRKIMLAAFAAVAAAIIVSLALAGLL